MSILKNVLLRVAVVFVLAYFVPVSSGPSMYASAAVLSVMLILAVVLLKAMDRHEALGEWIALELNKIRRVYHLAKNLGASENLRQWFTEVHEYVYAYLSSFEGKNFSEYEETNAAFRRVSYHVYQIPELKTDKERALYDELLDAAGLVAGARQRIKEIWNGGLPRPLWNLLVLAAAAAGAAVLFAVGSIDRLVAALLLSVLVIAVTLVRETDTMRTLDGGALPKRYVENIARLELRRRE
jgi:hypothetical protein